MIRLEKYLHKALGVVGLGKAGIAAVRVLLESGAQVYAWDDNEQSREMFRQKEPSLARHGHFHLKQPDKWPWGEMAALVLSPGVPLTHPQPHPSVVLAQRAKVPVMGEVDLLYQACPNATYIGITGTNGKSTTTALMGHVLQQLNRSVQVGGNLGTPALALRSLVAGEYYVLEMSSYQLDLCHKVLFDASVLLNITPDHLDRHGGMEGYVHAKKQIFTRQGENGLAMVSLDDGYCRDIYIDLMRERHVGLMPFSVTQKLDKGVFVDSEGYLLDLTDPDHHVRFPLTHIPNLRGRHNWQNVAAVYGVARYYGFDPNAIMEVIRSFKGLPHRLERVGEIGNVMFFNDSKATNAEAAAQALGSFADGIYWIVGGRAKTSDIQILKPFFPRIKHAYLMGEAEEMLAEQLQSHVPFTRCRDLNMATQKAASDALNAGQDAVVLLSPACSSFDQWPNFETRGDAFRAQIRGMIEAEGGGA